MEDRDASMTPDRAVLVKKLATLDTLLAKLTPLQEDDPDVMALANEKRLERQATHAALRAGRPTRTLLKTATDLHDKAKKRQSRALEEERGLHVLLERAQREQREATEAVAFHLDEISALERRLREEAAEASQPAASAMVLPPNVTQDQWNLFMAWMTQQQSAPQQPCTPPPACVSPTQSMTPTQQYSAPATPRQARVTTGQSTPVTAAPDTAAAAPQAACGPFRVRRDRSQQEPYQPEKPPRPRSPAQISPAHAALVEELDFGDLLSDDEDT